MNSIRINDLSVVGNKIVYDYRIEGEWERVFNKNIQFSAEYECDISGVPESILIIPLIANLLPVSWLFDADIYVKTIDSKFYNNIGKFKRAYCKMHKKNFGGHIHSELVIENKWLGDASAVFFSGGVDCMSTIAARYDCKPILVSIWGGDVADDNLLGWKNVLDNSKKIAEGLNLPLTTIRSSLRRYLNDDAINEVCYEQIGVYFWFGLQHNIGMIGLAAPLCIAERINTVYFAGTYSEKFGNQQCASDPSTDNFISYGSEKTVHDGYEFERQRKVENILKFKKEIPLRVCWKDPRGINCCKCEKCVRTIMEIASYGKKPQDYGFIDFSYEYIRDFVTVTYRQFTDFMKIEWKDIQETIIEQQLEKNQDISWVLDLDFNNAVPLEKVSSIFQEGCVIYGAGVAAKEIIKYMKANGVVPQMIVVSSKNNVLSEIDGIQLQEYATVKNEIKNTKAKVIIAMKDYSVVREIDKKLKENGIETVVNYYDIASCKDFTNIVEG